MGSKFSTSSALGQSTWPWNRSSLPRQVSRATEKATEKAIGVSFCASPRSHKSTKIYSSKQDMNSHLSTSEVADYMLSRVAETGSDHPMHGSIDL